MLDSSNIASELLNMSPDRLFWCLYFGDSLLACLLVVRICHLNLQKRLAWFLALTGIDLAVGSLGLVMGFRSRTYCLTFSVTEPAFLLVSVLATREIFSCLYQAYPGLKILARRTLGGSLAAGMLCATLAIPVTRSTWACPSFQCWSFVFFEFERFVYIGLAVFAVVMLVRLSRLPILITRNTWVHGIIFNTSLTVTVIGSIVLLLRHDRWSIWWLNIGSQVMSMACHSAWLLFLREEVTEDSTIRSVENAEVTQQLLKELTKFNEVLQLICPASRDRRRTRWILTLTRELLSRSPLH